MVFFQRWFGCLRTRGGFRRAHVTLPPNSRMRTVEGPARTHVRTVTYGSMYMRGAHQVGLRRPGQAKFMRPCINAFGWAADKPVSNVVQYVDMERNPGCDW